MSVSIKSRGHVIYHKIFHLTALKGLNRYLVLCKPSGSSKTRDALRKREKKRKRDRKKSNNVNGLL